MPHTTSPSDNPNNTATEHPNTTGQPRPTTPAWAYDPNGKQSHGRIDSGTTQPRYISTAAPLSPKPRSPYAAGNPDSRVWNRDWAGKFTAHRRSDPDITLPPSAEFRADAGDDGSDDWAETVTLPAKLEDVVLKNPGWTMTVSVFWTEALLISESAQVSDVICGDRWLRIGAAFVPGDDDASTRLRQEADFLEHILPTVCPTCGQGRPLRTECLSRFCASDATDQ